MSNKIRTNTSTKIDSVDFGVYTGAHEDTPGLVFHFSPQLQWKRVGRDKNGGGGVKSGGKEERNNGEYKRENKRARRGEERGEGSEVEGEGGAGRDGRMKTDRGEGEG